MRNPPSDKTTSSHKKIQATFLCLVLVALMGCPEDTASTNCTENPASCAALTDEEPARLYVDPPFGLGFDVFNWLQ